MEKTDILDNDATASGELSAAADTQKPLAPKLAPAFSERSKPSISLKTTEGEPPPNEREDMSPVQVNSQSPDKDTPVDTIGGSDLPRLGDYALMEEVGRGGMGVVYRARHEKLDKIMAVKMLHRELANDPINLKRFAQEARAASLLTHPNLVSVYDAGTASDGQPFLIMDFLEGQTLDAIVKNEGPLPLERFYNIFAQVCDALTHAHGKGVVHRDIKPSNIMILSPAPDQPEFVKLVDFGIARVFQQAAKDKKVTQTGDVIGSPTYMSPEQCLSGKLDARSDIYSLGIVMYEALTGKAPFGGDNAIQTILHHVQDKPAPLSCARADLPPGLEQAIMQTLEKQPNDRFQSIDELSDALELARNPNNVKPRKFVKFRRVLRKIKAKVADHSKSIIICAASILVLSSFSVLLNALAPHEDWRVLEQKGEDAFSAHDFDHAFEFWHSAVKEAQRSKATPFQQEKLDFDIASTLSRNAASHPAFEELARPYYDQLLAISDHHPEVVAIPPAWLYDCASSIQTDNPARAEMLYKRLIKQMDFMGRDAAKNEESIYSAAWMGLGSAQSELGKNKDAESAFKRSLTIAEGMPNSSGQVAEILDRLSKFYKYQGRDKEAQKTHKSLLRQRTKANTERPNGHT